MTLTEMASLLCISAGCCFFIAGSVGMVRLPDVFTRLHATTKADNIGLGLVIAGLLLLCGSLQTAGKLVAIWLLMMLAAATACQLIALAAWRRGARPWRKEHDRP